MTEHTQPEPTVKIQRFDKNNINPEEPWAGNLVKDREILANTLTRHINASGGPYVISISADWGMGKSDFLERWDYMLCNAEHKNLCFRFSAWEYDYTEDPFIAFATALNAFITNNPTCTADYIKDEAKNFGCKVLAFAQKKVINPFKRIANTAVASITALQGADADTAKLAGAAAASAVDIFEKDIGDLQNWLEQTAESRNEVRESLTAFAKKALDNKIGPIIVMVDELDRCKPPFAIALLEVIKHLFTVEGVVFILAVEQKQLCNCIAKEYGMSPKNATHYLHKFIDKDIPLPPIKMYNFICAHFKQPNFVLNTDLLPKKRDWIHISLQTHYNLNAALDSINLAEWVAAIIHDIVPSPREALQTMNQISLLSFNPEIDLVTLLLCSYALAKRTKNHQSLYDAITLEAPHNQKERMADGVIDNIIISYRNLFYGLVESRKAGQGPRLMKCTEFNRTNNSYYLSEYSKIFWDNLRFLLPVRIVINPDSNRTECYVWEHPNGNEWCNSVERFVNFIE